VGFQRRGAQRGLDGFGGGLQVALPAGPPQRRGDDELWVRVEPADRSLGCSRGGLSTKTYLAVDGHGRAAGRADRPSQGGDSRCFAPLLAAIRVPRLGGGRPPTRPTAVIADKAYSAHDHRPQRSTTCSSAAADPSKIQANKLFRLTSYRYRHVRDRPGGR
jgi:hypothetical protein